MSGSGRVCSLRKINFQNCQKILKTTPIMYKNKLDNVYYPYFLISVKYLSFTPKVVRITYNTYFLNILNILTIHVLLYLGKARERVFTFYPQPHPKTIHNLNRNIITTILLPSYIAILLHAQKKSRTLRHDHVQGTKHLITAY